MAAPIIALTKKARGKPFAWNSEAESAFKELKDRFSSEPVLVMPNPALPFVVEVGAYEVGVGPILSQRASLDNMLHPCAYCTSLGRCPWPRGIMIGDRELLVVKLALEELRHWFEGAEHPFINWTDHKYLEYFKQTKGVIPGRPHGRCSFAVLILF